MTYRVELCAGPDETVERTIAEASHPSIAYAAFYAATREYPERLILLRRRGDVLSRWRAARH